MINPLNDVLDIVFQILIGLLYSLMKVTLTQLTAVKLDNKTSWCLHSLEPRETEHVR